MNDCKDYIGKDIPACSVERPTHDDAIKMAGIMVGLDLSKPIDISLMNVRDVRSELYRDDYSFKDEYKTKREATLHTWVVNEFGEQEELTINIQLISKRMPKIE